MKTKPASPFFSPEKQTFDYWQGCLDPIWTETMQMIHPGKDITQAAKEAFGYLISEPARLQVTTNSDFKRLVNGWLSNKRPEKSRSEKPQAFDITEKLKQAKGT